MKSFTCEICGRVIESRGEDELVQQVQHHLKVDHGMSTGDAKDVDEPNIANEEADIRERIEDV